jgi:hypothetical protein
MINAGPIEEGLPPGVSELWQSSRYIDGQSLLQRLCPCVLRQRAEFDGQVYVTEEVEGKRNRRARGCYVEAAVSSVSGFKKQNSLAGKYLFMIKSFPNCAPHKQVPIVFKVASARIDCVRQSR